MRLHKLLAALGGIAALGMSGTAALAGPCGPAPCTPEVITYPASAPVQHPVVVTAGGPYDYLRSVEVKSTPNVNITQVYGQAGLPQLDDAPIRVSGGCHPQATYCAGPAPRPVPQVQPCRPAPCAPPAPKPMPCQPSPCAPAASYPAPTISYPTSSSGVVFERVSGPTFIDGQPVAEVVCAKAAPQPERRTCYQKPPQPCVTANPCVAPRPLYCQPHPRSTNPGPRPIYCMSNPQWFGPEAGIMVPPAPVRPAPVVQSPRPAPVCSVRSCAPQAMPQPQPQGWSWY